MKCVKCGETNEAEFYPSAIKRHDFHCKVCVRKRMKKWRLGHPGVEHSRRQAVRVEVLTHYGNKALRASLGQ